MIESAMGRWQTLSPAIDPRRSPIGACFIRSLCCFPKSGCTTSFEVRDDHVI